MHQTLNAVPKTVSFTLNGRTVAARADERIIVWSASYVGHSVSPLKGGAWHTSLKKLYISRLARSEIQAPSLTGA